MKLDHPPILIGIAGGSGSGKTHLAHQIRQLAGPGSVSVLSMDRYFRTEPQRDVQSVNFDHPAHLDLDLLEVHLAELKAGRSISAPTYNFRKMVQHPDTELIPAAPVIVVEGLFVLANPITDVLDLSCFLDVDADQRLLGRLLRDHTNVEQRWPRPSIATNGL